MTPRNGIVNLAALINIGGFSDSTAAVSSGGGSPPAPTATTWILPGYGIWVDSGNSEEYIIPGYGSVKEG